MANETQTLGEAEAAAQNMILGSLLDDGADDNTSTTPADDSNSLEEDRSEEMISGALDGTQAEEDDTEVEEEVDDDTEVDADEELEDDDDLDGDDDEDEDDESEDDEEDADEDDEEGHGKFDADYTYFDEAEGREVFLVADDPETGEKSVYLDRKSAKEGLAKQLKYIGQLKKEVEAERSARTDFESQTQEELNMFRQTLDRKAAKEMLIRAKLPEALQKLNPDEINGDDKYKEFQRGWIRAEAQVDQEIDQRREELKTTKAQRADARKAAESYVADRVKDYEFLGITNSEDKMAVKDLLKKEINGQTVKEILTQNRQTFGEEVADNLLKSFVSDLTTSRQKTTVQKAKKAKKKVKTVKRKAAPAQKAKDLDARSMLNAGLTLQGKPQK